MKRLECEFMEKNNEDKKVSLQKDLNHAEMACEDQEREYLCEIAGYETLVEKVKNEVFELR